MEPIPNIAPQETPRLWKELAQALREIIETVIFSLAIFLLLTTFLFQNFRVIGASMEPTLHTGEYIIVNKLVYRLHTPQRGDVVVFVFPQSQDRDFIKRILGVPGDKVQITRGLVYINDKLVEEPYLGSQSAASWGPQVLGQNEYFVLGDNRANSHDSRSWGTLPRDKIIGKAWVRYWPPSAWGSIPSIFTALAGP